MRDRSKREVRVGPHPQSEELPEVSSKYQGLAPEPSALEATRSATAPDDDAARLLPVLCASPLQAEARLGAVRGSAPVDASTAQTQPAPSAVLVLPQEPGVVRVALRGDSPSDGLRGLCGECDLGSP